MHHGSAHEKRLEHIVLAVFEEHRRRLTGFLTRGETPTEDLLQETLLRAWDHRRSLDSDGSVSDDELRERARRYVWRIARNLVIDELRWRRRHRMVSGALLCTMPDAAEQLEWQDSVRVVRETAARLKNARVRRCVALWLDGGDPAAIAGQLGLAAGQVRGLLQRGRAEVVRRVAARLGGAASRRRPYRDPRTRRELDTARQRAG
jgi:RNA polymerase sigma factor (sigma-70 family)